MNWYEVVECDKTVKNPIVVTEYDLLNNDKWDFMNGTEIQDWNDSSYFKTSKPEDDGDPDDVLQNVLMLPIYSKKLKNNLEEAGIKGIQYLPIRVFRFDGTLVDEFYIANILNLVPCLDWEKSKYKIKENEPDKVRMITKLVLKESALAEFDILRMYEFKLNIIVSEKFKKVFEKQKFTGYSFSKVEIS